MFINHIFHILSQHLYKQPAGSYLKYFMKSHGTLFALSFLLILTSCETLNQTAQVLNQSIGTPSATEIALGLKQALEVGTDQSTKRLHAKNGFLQNSAVKILFPPEAQKIETTLRSLGLSDLCDQVVTSLNRTAEDAVAEAAPIFVAAIRQMSISDASSILFSNQTDAATQYFKNTTQAQLTEKFRPQIQSSLSKVGATRYWSDVVNRYNQLPLVNRINPDLAGYVTQKTIEGLFVEISKEELQIRQSLSARSTTLLQKVFGYADRQRPH